MKQEQFDDLVAKLEQKALIQPQSYVTAVLLVAALGFVVLAIAMLFALVPLSLLAGLIFLVVVTGGKALIVLLKLGKLLVLLLIPAWVMLKSSFQLLFARFPKPQGRELSASEAPALFDRIAQIRHKMQGPKIHHVLLTQELNASIVQHPRLGLFGWEQNYLLLGLPLLQSMSENEALAVVAHEYGHLSGYHSRLGGFIYRFRTAWGRLQQISEMWRDWGSRLIANLFKWYAPYFNAYTFVYARRNEYVADNASVELAGERDTSNALIRVHVISQFEQEIFWPELKKLIFTQPEPVRNRSAFWRDRLENLDEETRVRYLEHAGKQRTNNFDTHPSLTDRLKAIGVEIDPDQARQLTVPALSAAQAWLTDHYQPISAEFDRQWQQQVQQQWQEQHAYLNAQQEKLNALESEQTKPDMEKRWQMITLREELYPEEVMSESVLAFAEEFPEHMAARYRRGVLRLDQKNEAGIDDLEYVMAQDADAILPACETVWRYYQNEQPEKAEIYRQRWIERSEYMQQVKLEFSSLPSNADLSEHGLDSETVEKIRKLIANDAKYIKKVYLLRRQLKTDHRLHDYVLAFETTYWTFGDKSAVVLKRLTAHEYPIPMFVVNLKSTVYSRFKKQIRKLVLTPIYQRQP